MERPGEVYNYAKLAELFEKAVEEGNVFDRNSRQGDELETLRMNVLLENVGERQLTIYGDEMDSDVLAKTPGGPSDWYAAWLDLSEIDFS